jgi:hypothetical protein
VGLEPGFHACYAEALERLLRCEDALPIYTMLYRGSGGGADGARFSAGAARCATALGRADAWPGDGALAPAGAGPPAGAYAPVP